CQLDQILRGFKLGIPFELFGKPNYDARKMQYIISEAALWRVPDPGNGSPSMQGEAEAPLHEGQEEQEGRQGVGRKEH
ncbi:hypothetical protein RFY98_06820, partial [Acinetobacter baumannii]|nr:hypothetical protein [Acinetobacter baumannii]